MEKVLWLIEHVKSGLCSFVLEISCWTMLYGQVDPLEVNGDLIEALTENNQSCTLWETTKILKTSKSTKGNHL